MEKPFQFTSKWSNIDSWRVLKVAPEARGRRKLLCHRHRRFVKEVQIIESSVCISEP